MRQGLYTSGGQWMSEDGYAKKGWSISYLHEHR